MELKKMSVIKQSKTMETKHTGLISCHNTECTSGVIDADCDIVLSILFQSRYHVHGAVR